MLSNPSLIPSLIVLISGCSSFSLVKAEPMPVQRDTSGTAFTEQQEELFLAPPLAEEQEGWIDNTSEFTQPQNKVRLTPSPKGNPSDWQPSPAQPGQPTNITPSTLVPKSSDRVEPATTESAQPRTKAVFALPAQPTQSRWFELTPPKDSHWRNQPSFPPRPEAKWERFTKPHARNREVRPGWQRTDERWKPWSITPIVEPSSRLYIEAERTKPHAKVRLNEAQLQTILVDEKIHHRIIGQLLNPTPSYVYNLRVYYRIRQGLQTVDVGQFSMGVGKRLAPGEQIRFAYSVPINGELEISFIEWKYEDGSQGVAERGVL